MQINHRPSKILIVGKSGSGKSTYLIRWVENSGHDRVFIFDHKLEFHVRAGIVPSFTLDECVKRIQAGERFVSYHPSEEYPGASDLAFQDFSSLVFESCKVLRDDGKKSLYVCDEVNRFTTFSSLGDKFIEVIEDGRLQGLDFAGTSHAANQIHNRLRLQLTEIVALRTHDKRPLEFLEESGFNTEDVQALPVGSYIVRNLDTENFTSGKLFSCARPDKDLEAQETPTKNHGTIPDSATDTDPVHRNGGAGERD